MVSKLHWYLPPCIFGIGTALCGTCASGPLIGPEGDRSHFHRKLKLPVRGCPRFWRSSVGSHRQTSHQRRRAKWKRRLFAVIAGTESTASRESGIHWMDLRYVHRGCHRPRFMSRRRMWGWPRRSEVLVVKQNTSTKCPLVKILDCRSPSLTLPPQQEQQQERAYLLVLVLVWDRGMGKGEHQFS